jgi:SAM-dependent methyltransferase
MTDLIPPCSRELARASVQSKNAREQARGYTQMTLLCALLFLTTLLRADPPTTAPATTEPAPLTHYMGREIAQTMHFTGAEWLTRESREREEDCTTMLKQLNLKSGQTVVDFGCGNGFYTLKMAKLVAPNGKVLAVDIQPEMLDLLRQRAKDEKIDDIDEVLCTTTDPKLPEGKVDLILIVDTYHEISNPVEVLAGLRKSLAPHGRVALVEFRGEDPNVPIKPLHKMSKAQIMKEWPANGFKLVDQFDGLPWQHLMFFERDDSATTLPAK